MLTKRIFTVILLFFVPLLMFAQVTTSTITGTVTAGESPLTGATISVTHQPTGAIFRTTSLNKGSIIS
jgi:uncharacterized membrane protein YgaE (UPF0421/DUF939 family)